MQKTVRIAMLLPALALAACGVTPQVSTLTTDTPAPSTVDPIVLQAPAQTVSSAAANTDVSAFVDPTAFGAMGAKSKSEAAAAQFNALQFGRVGAPRTWAGDKGQTGSIQVGPYVRVNLIDCRDFTNTVTINGQDYVKKGTACREADGHWTVSATATG